MVAPIFLLLVFAVIEYSLINSAVGAYNFGAKDAARHGAIVGPTESGADCKMLQIIESHVVGVVAAKPVEVDIFEATESGTYSSTALQDKYSYTAGGSACPSDPRWSLISANWQPGTACPTPPCRNDRLVSQDYLGVHIIYHYTYVTAFFSSLGATITLNADSVQRIEPQELRHSPTPKAGPAIAALAPATPAAPSLDAIVDMGALAPLWAFLMARAVAMWRASETGEKERQS